MKYHLEVYRDKLETFGPGFMILMRGEEGIEKWDVITGGEQLNPREFGGITPPITFTVQEEIAYRDHPATRRGKMTMARIYPTFEEKVNDYNKRTFDLFGPSDYPFMVHPGSKRVGSSTGCIAVLEGWPRFVGEFNQAFRHSQANGYDLLITVFDLDE